MRAQDAKLPSGSAKKKSIIWKYYDSLTFLDEVDEYAVPKKIKPNGN